MYLDRLEAAIAVAPSLTPNGMVPAVDSQGKIIPSFSEDPRARTLDDYDMLLLDEGHVCPGNAIEVSPDRLAELYDHYAMYLFKTMSVWPSWHPTSRDSAVPHERRHAIAFEALGASAVLCQLRFALGPGEEKRPVYMQPYTLALDLKICKLGLAAAFLAPPRPSRGDFIAVEGYGYTPKEVITKVRAHNERRRPRLPRPMYVC